ncbi:M20/M25/M40 family metallo-hydrolase [Ekhidna sp. To15]|uniref:M20/M25/M40 family metallo-hydrolase n=1 Tax=Ekhidna sp. To15 TaxID=3395267 RepID=UPI003F5217C2
MRIIYALSVLLSFTISAQDINKLAEKHIEENAIQILNDFKTLLAIPNVAYDLPNINKNAEHIIAELNKRGVETKLLRMVGTPPIVYGYYPVKGAKRTLAFYVHYDGQPADKTKWTHNPWEPTYYSKAMVDDGEPIDFPVAFDEVDEEHRIYARSAGDDKAPVITILTALDLIQANKMRATSNLVFFFEGQEEAGSRQLQQYLNDNRELVDQIDLWLFCDGPVHQSRKPQLVFGVRGVTGMEITTYGPNRPLHSGHYGNWAPVPGQLLSELIASMKDADGNIVIDGYYDDVEPLSELEKESMKSIPLVDEGLKQELGINDPEGTESYNERLLLPSLTIRGLSSGNTGKLARNVVPSTATAAIGMRLVKGCDPEKQKDYVEAHIRKQGFHIVREDPDQETRMKYPKIAKVTRESGYPAARTSMDLPITQDVIARTKDVAGDDLILLPTLGGSLPLYLFTDELKKPAIILPIANHDNNQHAADENLRIGNLWYGIKLMSALMTMDK